SHLQGRTSPMRSISAKHRWRVVGSPAFAFVILTSSIISLPARAANPAAKNPKAGAADSTPKPIEAKPLPGENSAPPPPAINVDKTALANAFSAYESAAAADVKAAGISLAIFFLDPQFIDRAESLAVDQLRARIASQTVLFTASGF